MPRWRKSPDTMSLIRGGKSADTAHLNMNGRGHNQTKKLYCKQKTYWCLLECIISWLEYMVAWLECNGCLARRFGCLDRRFGCLARRFVCLARRFCCLARRFGCLARKETHGNGTSLLRFLLHVWKRMKLYGTVIYKISPALHVLRHLSKTAVKYSIELWTTVCCQMVVCP